MPPLRGWILVVFVPPFSQKSGSHALSEARADFALPYAALEGPIFHGDEDICWLVPQL
jgi:hypothetical protein